MDLAELTVDVGDAALSVGHPVGRLPPVRFGVGPHRLCGFQLVEQPRAILFLSECRAGER